MISHLLDLTKIFCYIVFMTEKKRSLPANAPTEYKVDNAVILAAGFGSRFTPISLCKPKGLVKIGGVPLVERQILHLLQKGICDITLITGYMAEAFFYLKDKYGVKFIFNPDHAVKNNLSSLYFARKELKNTYILSSDNYMSENIYSPTETMSWYSCAYAHEYTNEWCLDLDDDNRIVDVHVGGKNSWYMYGSVFFNRDFSDKMVPLLEKYYPLPEWADKYWEDILIAHANDLPIYAKKFSENIVYEFESLDELRAFDRSTTEDEENPYIAEIAELLAVPVKKIREFSPVASAAAYPGAFRFSVENKRFVALPANHEDMPANPLAQGRLLHVYPCE